MSEVANTWVMVLVNMNLVVFCQCSDQSGVRDIVQLKAAKKKVKLAQRSFARKGTQGESDRVVVTKKPKHLFAGKRKKGKTGRR